MIKRVTDIAGRVRDSIPIAAAIVLAAQIVTMVWVVRGAFSDIEQHTKMIEANAAQIERLNARVEAARDVAAAQAVQLGRIEEIGRATRDAVEMLLRRDEGGRR